MNHRLVSAALVLGMTGVATSAEPEKVESATESEEGKEAEVAELARAAQNPVANLVSIPFQNNTNFGYGPANNKGTQNVLNIQPVVPITLTRDWNLITRTIIPLVWQPSFVPGGSGSFGLLPINGNVTAYWNAVKPDIGPEWTLRVQAAILLPKQLLGL